MLFSAVELCEIVDLCRALCAGYAGMGEPDAAAHYAALAVEPHDAEYESYREHLYLARELEEAVDRAPVTLDLERCRALDAQLAVAQAHRDLSELLRAAVARPLPPSLPPADCAACTGTGWLCRDEVEQPCPECLLPAEVGEEDAA